jgi:hypothetical protein
MGFFQGDGTVTVVSADETYAEGSVLYADNISDRDCMFEFVIR